MTFSQPHAARANDPIEELYQAHALTLTRFALLLVGDKATAEDVVQDAFLGLYRNRDQLRERSGYSRTCGPPSSTAAGLYCVPGPDGSGRSSMNRQPGQRRPRCSIAKTGARLRTLHSWSDTTSGPPSLTIGGDEALVWDMYNWVDEVNLTTGSGGTFTQLPHGGSNANPVFAVAW